jgi:hypothetical protein
MCFRRGKTLQDLSGCRIHAIDVEITPVSAVAGIPDENGKKDLLRSVQPTPSNDVVRLAILRPFPKCPQFRGVNFRIDRHLPNTLLEVLSSWFLDVGEFVKVG